MVNRKSNIVNPLVSAALVLAVFLACPVAGTAAEVFGPEDVMNLQVAVNARVSPDGKWIAYTVSVPRGVNDKAGTAYSELHVVSTGTGTSRPFVTGKVNVGSVEWSPDGKVISFLMKRGEKAEAQVWTIPVDGGEASQATSAKNGVISYSWHPAGAQLAYTATEPDTKREKKLDDKGYGFVFFEENLKHRNLYLVNIKDYQADGDPVQLTENITVWSFDFNHDGSKIAAGASEKNLVDYRYVFQHIYMIDVASKEISRFSDNPGKLGGYAFSPDDRYVAYCGALTRRDHAVSQLYVKPVGGGETRNLTEPDFKGHVEWAGWKDNNTIVYLAGEGVENTLNTVRASDGKNRKVILHSKNTGMIFEAPHITNDFKHMAFTASSPEIPRDVYYWTGKGKPKRLTTLNPWLAERKLGKREVVTYQARDGWEVEGLLNYPVDYDPAQKYPLIVFVHGGPESHYSNDWRTSYSNAAQVLNGRGYLVFFPNYRGSTGYGLAHIEKHYGDPAGVEFDDIADGIEYLVAKGIADPGRVGLGGGSYGGYAAAWFATYYTKYVRAVQMYVGISDLVSKRSTTDIPYEELFVHSIEKLENVWEKSLERSPIYYAGQSRTATLIIGGTSDTRVNPGQSIEFYRQLKMNDHPAVRLVQYPGEGHGNRKMPGRRDVLYRTLQWFDWYVKDLKPLDGEMPPLDISDQYGVDLPDGDKEGTKE